MGGSSERRHLPSQTTSVLMHRTSVSEANIAGDVHGGWIMKWCDDAAVIAATRHAASRVVTLAVDGVLFRQPVKVSNLLMLKATVNAAWHTSMEVGVRVEAEDPRTQDVRHTLTAYLTMIALDSEGRPTAVPSLEPADDEELRRWREANVRRGIRLADPSELARRLDGSVPSTG